MSSTQVSRGRSSMTEQSTCLCCISIRPGLIALAIVSCVMSGLLLATCINTLVNTGVDVDKIPEEASEIHIDAPHDFGNNGTAKQLLSGFTVGGIYGTLAVAILLFTASIMLVVGAIRRISCLLWPYIIIGAISVVALVLLMILLIAGFAQTTGDGHPTSDEWRNFGFIVAIMSMIIVAVSYFTYTVWRGRRIFSIEEAMH